MFTKRTYNAIYDCTHRFLSRSHYPRAGMGLTDEDKKLYPLLLDKVSLLDNFREPCNCLKCARGRFCACRLINIACCIFCKCGSSEQCQNPNRCNQQTFVSLYVLEVFCLCTYLYQLVELILYTRGCINDLAFTKQKIVSLTSRRGRKIFCCIHLFIGKIPHFAILSPTIAFM